MIVAADGDYDPAIVHARSKGRQVERVEVLRAAPVEVKSAPVQRTPPQPPTASSPPAGKAIEPIPLAHRSRRSKSVDRISSEILRDFSEAGKPKTLSALEKRIQWRFGPKPVPEKVADVMSALVASGVIKIANGSLKYGERIIRDL